MGRWSILKTKGQCGLLHLEIQPFSITGGTKLKSLVLKFDFQTVEALLPCPNLSIPKNICHFEFMVCFVPAHFKSMPALLERHHPGAGCIACREVNASSFLLPSVLGNV